MAHTHPPNSFVVALSFVISSQSFPGQAVMASIHWTFSSPFTVKASNHPTAIKATLYISPPVFWSCEELDDALADELVRAGRAKENGPLPGGSQKPRLCCSGKIST